jgi:hypothetical protein
MEPKEAAILFLLEQAVKGPQRVAAQAHIDAINAQREASGFKQIEDEEETHA